MPQGEWSSEPVNQVRVVLDRSSEDDCIYNLRLDTSGFQGLIHEAYLYIGSSIICALWLPSRDSCIYTPIYDNFNSSCNGILACLLLPEIEIAVECSVNGYGRLVLDADSQKLDLSERITTGFTDNSGKLNCICYSEGIAAPRFIWT